MTGQSLKTTLAAVLMLGLFADSSWASKTGKTSSPPKTELKSLKGTVQVVRDKAGQITAVRLKVGKIVRSTYTITLDEKGRDLGDRMAKKQVLVKGLVEKKSGVKWLTVKEYTESPSKPAKKSTKA